MHQDELYYSLRVVEAYRGGSLGNPYLLEHESAVKYLPEMVERVFAFGARLLHMDPLNLLALSRVAFPVAIYFLLYDLSRRLGASPRFAILAGMFAPLLPSLTGRMWLRYFRTLSPAAYVLLELLTARLIWEVYYKRSLLAVFLAGSAVGFLFYAATPYSWSFIVGSLFLLALSAKERETRIALLATLMIGGILGIPYLWHTLAIRDLPAVRDSLAYNNLMIPGRWPEPGTLPRFGVGMLFVAGVVFWRDRLGRAAHFLLPFLLTGSLLLIQNVITNRQMQSGHWTQSLIPFCGIALFLLLDKSRLNSSKVVLSATLLLFLGALTSQVIFYQQWRTSLPDNVIFWLDRRMPETIAWLNGNTPPRSVVLSDAAVSSALPVFTHNKVYWAWYADQYALEQSEVLVRQSQAQSWPSKPVPLTYRADYYLGIGGEACHLGAGHLIYKNAREATCLYAIRGSQ